MCQIFGPPCRDAKEQCRSLGGLNQVWKQIDTIYSCRSDREIFTLREGFREKWPPYKRDQPPTSPRQSNPSSRIERRRWLQFPREALARDSGGKRIDS